MEHTVSVIVPTYNNAATINAAMESIYLQNFRHLELIIVDDGSGDETEAVVRRRWSGQRYLYFRQDNRGPAAARNLGIKLSTGSHIAFLDADDVWLPGHLERSLPFLDSGPFDWMATGYYNGNPGKPLIYRSFPADSPMYDRATGAVTLLADGLFDFSSVHIWTGTLLFRRSCLLQLGGFDESFRAGEDWDLYLRAEEAGFTCGFLDEPTAVYNFNPASITKSSRCDCYREHLRVAGKHRKILQGSCANFRKSYADFIWNIGRKYYSRREYLKTIFCSLRSLALDMDLTKLQSLVSTRLNG